MSASLSPSPREALAPLEQRCAHMAGEAATRLSVVTAQQAALAANLAKAIGIVDRLDGVMQLMLDERVRGVASLLRHLKQTGKQLELWQSAAAVTASQLLALADLIDNGSQHKVDDWQAIDVAASARHSSALTSAFWLLGRPMDAAISASLARLGSACDTDITVVLKVRLTW